MHLRRLVVFSAVSSIAVAGAACSSPGRQAAWETGGEAHRAAPGTPTEAHASLEAVADDAWAKRDDKAELTKAIETWERIIAEDPSNTAALVKLSRAYYFLGDGHVSLEDGDRDEELLAIYEKGVNAGEKALLALEPEFEKEMRGGADMKDAVAKIGPKGAPAAYWYCTNLGRFSLLKGLSARLFYKDRVKAAMDRIYELDKSFFYSGPERYYAVLYAALPSIAGKDLEKSKSFFELAIDGSPDYLTTRVLKAHHLAAEMDDRAMYEATLKEVLAAPDGDNPDFAPENRAAKRRAAKLLAQADERF